MLENHSGFMSLICPNPIDQVPVLQLGELEVAFHFEIEKDSNSDISGL